MWREIKRIEENSTDIRNKEKFDEEIRCIRTSKQREIAWGKEQLEREERAYHEEKWDNLHKDYSVDAFLSAIRKAIREYVEKAFNDSFSKEIYEGTCAFDYASGILSRTPVHKTSLLTGPRDVYFKKYFIDPSVEAGLEEVRGQLKELGIVIGKPFFASWWCIDYNNFSWAKRAIHVSNDGEIHHYHADCFWLEKGNDEPFTISYEESGGERYYYGNRLYKMGSGKLDFQYAGWGQRVPIACQFSYKLN